MTLPQVKAAWGRPQAITTEMLPRRGRTIELQYDFAAYTVTLIGLPRRERVVAVGTTLAKQRPRQGVGVGSPERRLRRLFRGELSCDRFDVVFMPRSSIPMLGQNERRCTLGDKDGPHTVFTSRIRLQTAWDQHRPADWPRWRASPR